MMTSAEDKQVESVRIKIGQVRLLDSDGSVTGELPAELQLRETVVSLYTAMVRNRLFDEQAVSLQRTGRLGTFASALGQEAVAVAVAMAMEKDDVFIPSFREQGGQLVRGVSVEELLSFWGGDERGSAFANAPNDFPVCIPVGSQFPHASGAALAFKLKQLDHVAIVFGGDGSTSKGDFYEALNMAGVWDLPVIFVIVNNQWAISTPRQQQTHAGTLAQKSLAAGIPGTQVDGNDVFAVHQVVTDALVRARNGNGASLIEALTYRMSDHTTADDASRYRSDDEVEKQRELDPLLRVKKYLTDNHHWTDEQDQQVYSSCTDEITSGVNSYLHAESALPSDMFDYLFEQLPVTLQQQRASVMKAGD